MTTGPSNYEVRKDGSEAFGIGSGDSVIRYHPSFKDDTLFHELVHAYRYSRKRHERLIVEAFFDANFPLTQTLEDFFANQMMNIYLSQDHRKLELDYVYPKPSTKQEVYDFLEDQDEMIKALKYLLKHEYLAMIAAHTFHTDYNPFRDYAQLEAKLVKLYNHALPELEPSHVP